MEIDFTSFFEKQLELDKTIQDNFSLTYFSTRKQRFLSFLVELGELANETRCFKYWSKKPSSEKKVVLEEYIDALHFLLSLGLDANIDVTTYQTLETNLSTVEIFIELYKQGLRFFESRSKEDYVLLFNLFLSLGFKLDFSMDDIKNGYLDKLKINYKRQNEGY